MIDSRLDRSSSISWQIAASGSKNSMPSLASRAVRALPLELGPGEVVGELGLVAGTHDQRGDAVTSQQPGEGDLGGRAAARRRSQSIRRRRGKGAPHRGSGRGRWSCSRRGRTGPGLPRRYLPVSRPPASGLQTRTPAPVSIAAGISCTPRRGHPASSRRAVGVGVGGVAEVDPRRAGVGPRAAFGPCGRDGHLEVPLSGGREPDLRGGGEGRAGSVGAFGEPCTVVAGVDRVDREDRRRHHRGDGQHG